MTRVPQKGPLKRPYRAPLKGFGLDIRQALECQEFYKLAECKVKLRS